MNKKSALFVGGMIFTLLFASPAAASPLKWSGDVSVKYERDTAAEAGAVSGAMYTTTIKGEKELGKNWSLYFRLGAQYATQPSLSDYNISDAVYGSDKKSVAALDQFGLTYSGENLTWKLGRQDIGVGVTSLLYSRPETNIGRRAFVDGLTVEGSLGKVDIKAAIAQEDNAEDRHNKLYAVRAGFKPSERLQWGVTLARYQDSLNGNSQHWAVDGTYQIGKSSVTVEYTRSNKQSDNTAYAAVWNYDFDGKWAASLTSFRVFANGDIGGQSDFDNGNQGMYYGVTYKLSDSQNLGLVYKDQKTISDGQKNTKLECTFSQTF